ncbi:MAG: 23S rRNA (adenine(2503)-C(2))-methyltransferase RlmN [Bacteriovoracaceae bacterium]
MKKSFFSLTHKELINLFGTASTQKLTRQIYRRHKISWKDIPQLKKETAELLLNYSFDIPVVKEFHQSEDGTVKFLMQFSDVMTAETVLIPFHKRYTVCLSTQVGCAMGCSFCYTGTQGLKRNLVEHEIIGQYLVAWMWLEKNVPEKSIPPHIVFMGQGEPLHNFDHVKKATELFLEINGIGLGPRQITLSTAGYLPGLKRFDQFPAINLALSLHSTDDKTRSQLIPLNKTYSMEELFQTLDLVPLKKRQFITFEYLMIQNLNMEKSDITGLVQYLKPRKAILNLIPFNPFPGSKYQRPSNIQIDQFKNSLVESGVHVMIRNTKGDSILAACGQLTSK